MLPGTLLWQQAIYGVRNTRPAYKQAFRRRLKAMADRAFSSLYLTYWHGEITQHYSWYKALDFFGVYPLHHFAQLPTHGFQLAAVILIVQRIEVL